MHCKFEDWNVVREDGERENKPYIHFERIRVKTLNRLESFMVF